MNDYLAVETLYFMWHWMIIYRIRK